MPFETLVLPGLIEGDAPEEIPAIELAVFSDDIELPAGGRAAVRVVIRGLSFDFTDSSALTDENKRFALAPEEVRIATTLALAHTLDIPPTDALADRLDLVASPSTWIGCRSDGSDRGAVVMGMGRVFDAVLGALGRAWPARVGAGSNSVGAIVEIASDGETHLEVVPGGEGATPVRDGRGGWAGPIAAASGGSVWPRWLDVLERTRVGSGGGGARRGGDGVTRIYTLAQDAIAHVGIDRRSNPPHGIDRAGPPEPSRLSLIARDSTETKVASWTDVEVPAGYSLKVETAGGAGHGFPGYGDIEWDPSGWF